MTRTWTITRQRSDPRVASPSGRLGPEPAVRLADDRRVAAAQPHLGGDGCAELRAAGACGSQAGELRRDLLSGEEPVGGSNKGLVLHALTLHLDCLVVNQIHNRISQASIMHQY